MSPSKNWDEYRDTTLEILEIVDTCRTDDDTPLPVLSSAISGAIDPAALGEVFEISQVPIEALDPVAAGEGDAPPPDPPELQLDVVSSDVPSFTADLSNELGVVILGQPVEVVDTSWIGAAALGSKCVVTISRGSGLEVYNILIEERFDDARLAIVNEIPSSEMALLIEENRSACS